MDFLKKYWSITLLTLGTIALGLTVFITSQRVQQTEQVAPAQPKAATQACTVSFSITPPKSCTLAVNFSGATNTPTPTPTATPTVTPTTTATPTPTPAACNSTCASTPDCASGMVCSGGRCRNPSCVDSSTCVCAGATNTPTPTPTPAPRCNSTCSVSTDCPSSMVCSSGYCRNPSCTENTNCVCAGATPTPTAAPTPQIPVSGTGPSIMGLGVLGAGALLILLGLAF